MKTMNILSVSAAIKCKKRRIPLYLYRYQRGYNDRDGLYISKFKELSDIANGEIINVYPLDNKDGGKWYAPELHRIGDAWYIYVSPDYGDWLHQMTVLKLQGDSPIGIYENLGVIKGLEGKWAIDGTVFEYQSKWYFIWTFGDGTLSMQEMVSPDELNINSKRMLLTKAELPFETVILSTFPYLSGVFKGRVKKRKFFHASLLFLIKMLFFL